MPAAFEACILGGRRYTMAEVISTSRELSLGFKVRRLRVSQLLTQQELANMAGVSPEYVNLLEHNLPLPLDAKRRLLQKLWARKADRF